MEESKSPAREMTKEIVQEPNISEGDKQLNSWP